MVMLMAVTSVAGERGGKDGGEKRTSGSDTTPSESGEADGGGEAVPTLECPEKPAKAKAARKLAGRLFSAAESAYVEKRHVEALKKFLCSMSIVAHENTVTNIEKAVGGVSEDEKALALLKEYLARAPDDELTSRIERMAGDLEKKIEKEKAAQSEPVCPEPEPVTKPCPEAKPPLASLAEKRAFKIMKITGWTEVGVGAATFVAAIILQGMAAAAKNKAEEASNYDIFLEQKQKNKVFQVSASTAFVTGVVLAGAGVTHLYFLNRQKGESGAPSPEAGVELSLVPGVGWLGVEGKF
jgi:hypothetical protein